MADTLEYAIAQRIISNYGWEDSPEDWPQAELLAEGVAATVRQFVADNEDEAIQETVDTFRDEGLFDSEDYGSDERTGVLLAWAVTAIEAADRARGLSTREET